MVPIAIGKTNGKNKRVNIKRRKNLIIETLFNSNQIKKNKS